MIHYQLRCSQDHDFDGWFSDSAGFDRQAERGLIECPACGDLRVRRAMMAPAVAKRAIAGPRPPGDPLPADAVAADQAPAAGAGPASAASAGSVDGRMPDHVRASFQRLRAEVEKNCDYVGGRFAQEARRIHRGEIEQRGIYGETTPDQAEALADEGISVSRIPWVPRADG